MDYQTFLASKRQVIQDSGFELSPEAINPMAFAFQRDIILWALRRGKAAIFAECGLGKTLMELEWGRHVAEYTGGQVLILAPLAVSYQTVSEGHKFGIAVRYCREQSEVGDTPLVITNYERLHKFDADKFIGVILDESGIIKSFMGKTKQAIFKAFANTPYKLACSATPSPNDHMELGNHSQFLDVMDSNEMLARWFINDTMEMGNYRLKHHAEKDFWRWITSWAVCLSEPRDLGKEYHLKEFTNPQLHIIEHSLAASDIAIKHAHSQGMLFPDTNPTATGLHRAKRDSLNDRIAKSTDILAQRYLLGLSNSEGIIELPFKIEDSQEDVQCHQEIQKKTSGICTNIICEIRSVTKNIDLVMPKGKTSADGNVIETTQNIGESALKQQRSEIRLISETLDCGQNLESGQKNITLCLMLRKEDALFVENVLATRRVENSMLTIAMQPAESEDYYVLVVIWDLGNSKTIRICCEERLSISELEPVVIWCETNEEQDILAKSLGDLAISVYGSLTTDKKETYIKSWLNADAPILISKPSICGFGMNFQRCHTCIFVGVSYSFEQTYQALKRFHRFGQQYPVNAHIVYAETEGGVRIALKRKEKAFSEMQANMNQAMWEYGMFRDSNRMTLQPAQSEVAEGENWTLYLGDCVERIRLVPDNSIHLGVHSPPFSSLYIYSDSDADMGNSADDKEFFKHYRYLIGELYRTTMPGRLCAVHCKDLPNYMNRDGAAGLRDFAGDVIRAFEQFDMPELDDFEDMQAYKEALATWKAQGPKWQYHSRITIWKDPVIEMQRTKNHGLLHRNFAGNAEATRQGMPDYMVVFRKWPIDGGTPVVQNRQWGDYIGGEPPALGEISGWGRSEQQSYSIATWQRYASPVWFDIDQTNVLNFKLAKDNNDEKHIAPLQLDVIARCIDLWTNKGEIVLSPFAGVGSEGVVAIKMGRQFVGVELKESYYNTACKHLKEAELAASQKTLFDMDALKVK